MPYACGSDPAADDLVECVAEPSGRRPKQRVGERYWVSFVHPDGYIRIGDSDYISKASRFRLVQREWTKNRDKC